ncbi:MAG TPA: GNAT family N-acetyltransferase [Candidatus Sulfotelmatobacter sp.]|nr:GNAT family N-acetyltransferase [Candidatus Sulfotelmatobacter sp.]
MTTAYKLAIEIKAERVTVSAQRGGVEVIDQLEEEWRTLCTESPDDQPFYRPEWIRAHLRAFVPEARILLITARIGTRLCLLLPMIEEKNAFYGLPLRRLRSPVNSHGGRFDAVRTAGPVGDAAVSAMWDFLEELDCWDLIDFQCVPVDSTIDLLMAKADECGLHTAQVPEKPNPYVPVPSDIDLLRQMPLNSRLRTKLRQARRELKKQGSLNFFRLDVADRDALDRFYQLEASGWKGQERSAIACNVRTRQFYDEIAEVAARFGYFSLYVLELNGQLLAAHFSLTSPNRCYSPKVAYNENFKEFAPGHLIVAEILQDCALRGIQGFDITGPDDEWKMKWTSETRAVNHHFIFKGAIGNLAHALRFRLRPAIARQLHRKPRSA